MPNSSGVRAMESSPYGVRDDRVLLYQGRMVVEVCSSFGQEPIIPSIRTGGPLNMFTGLLNWQGGFMALW